MIIAFCACMNDSTDLPIRGNGKTNAMTGYSYLNYREGKKIYTNYQTYNKFKPQNNHSGTRINLHQGRAVTSKKREGRFWN